MIATIVILIILLILTVLFGLISPVLMSICLVTMEEHRRDLFDKVKSMLKKKYSKIYDIIDKAMVNDFSDEIEEKLKKVNE